MSLDKLIFIHRAQLSFFDDELAADNRVIGIDRLSKDYRGNRIVHAGKADAIQVDGEEVGAFASF
jgi:hypothetical protein